MIKTRHIKFLHCIIAKMQHGHPRDHNLMCTFRQQHGADSQRGHEVCLLVLKFSRYTQTIFKNS